MRFLPESTKKKVIDYWHLSKGYRSDRHSRLLIVTDWLKEEYPGVSITGIYKDVDSETRDWCS